MKRICRLNAEMMALAFKPWIRMQRAGYVSVAEFFDKHGWDLTVKQIHAILDSEIGPLPSDDQVRKRAKKHSAE